MPLFEFKSKGARINLTEALPSWGTCKPRRKWKRASKPLWTSGPDTLYYCFAASAAAEHRCRWQKRRKRLHRFPFFPPLLLLTAAAAAAVPFNIEVGNLHSCSMRITHTIRDALPSKAVIKSSQVELLLDLNLIWLKSWLKLFSQVKLQTLKSVALSWKFTLCCRKLGSEHGQVVSRNTSNLTLNYSLTS